MYSDIFDFPLTEEEIWRGLISDKKIDRDLLKKTLDTLCKNGSVIYAKGYYCLAGKKKIINKRLDRTKNIQKKLKIANTVSKILSYIPTVYFIGLTGRLSHLDAEKDDDIDMIFITRKKTIWITRLILLSVLEYLNVRRVWNDKKPSNKICPNLILDETALLWPKGKRDIYTAHEIVNIYPLYDKNNIFQKFLKKNNWITRYYPNLSWNKTGFINPKKYFTLNFLSFFATLPLFEFAAGRIQKIYMGNKITNETLRPNLLAFHPHDYRLEILNSFSERIKKLNQ